MSQGREGHGLEREDQMTGKQIFLGLKGKRRSDLSIPAPRWELALRGSFKNRFVESELG